MFVPSLFNICRAKSDTWNILYMILVSVKSHIFIALRFTIYVHTISFGSHAGHVHRLLQVRIRRCSAYLKYGTLFNVFTCM